VTSRTPDAPIRRPVGAECALVLIVDDSEQNLKLTRDVLRAAGFRTLEATNGAAAVLLAAEHLPDVVLLDLQLPDMGGADVARKLAQEIRTARIPTVALSAQALEGSGDWLLASGFAGYIEKPIRVDEFPDQVRGYCTRTGT
jgi:two-component system cell cycle response regulator DivK